MIKWFVITVGVIGMYFLLNMYAPTTTHTGFVIPVGQGYFVSWMLVLCFVFLVMASRLKAK